MWTDVSSSFDEMLTELKWMDVGTKARAHRKLLAMRPFIGFPEWVTKPEKLAKYYEKVSFTKNNGLREFEMQSFFLRRSRFSKEDCTTRTCITT